MIQNLCQARRQVTEQGLWFICGSSDNSVQTGQPGIELNSALLMPRNAGISFADR